MRHRGGGHKRRYRKVDFKRRKFDVPATVERLEYDPNRSAFIALIRYEDDEQAYILAPQRVSPGDKVVSGERCDIKPGNAMPMSNIPVGTIIHNVEMKPGKGGQIARSAGNYVQLVGKDQGYAQLRLPSGEQRIVHARCMATIGAVSNPDNQNTNQGKAEPHALEGPAALGARRRHEPGGPSAWRRRGQVLGRTAPGHPLGRADQGQAHAEQQENRPLHHAASGARSRAGDSRWRAPYGKAPSSDGYLLKKAEEARATGRKDIIRTWSRRSTILPQFVGLTFGVYNGAQVPARAGEREHGRPQVRRVLADTGLPRPCRRQEGAAGAENGQERTTPAARRDRSPGGDPEPPDQPAEARPGRRDHPRAPGGPGADHARAFAPPHRRRRAQVPAVGDRERRKQSRAGCGPGSSSRKRRSARAW